MPRQSITISAWTGGCNSLVHPAYIPKSQYAWGENIVNRGGIIQTRPGYRVLGSIPGTKLQGMCIFTPRGSTARVVVAVDGKIYSAKFPSYEFTLVSLDLKFSAEADIINMTSCVQSVERKADGTIKLITPTPILMICDGTSQAGYWDGANAKMLIEAAPERQTPIGCLWMTWTSGCLWMSRGSTVLVSDLGNPLSFFDNQYLAGRSNFELPGDVTGMVETSDQRGLLVFTQYTTTSFQSQIRLRTEWGNTPDFQRLLFPSIGCVAGRAACNQYGLTHWLSASGFMSLDAASYSLQSARMTTIDGEMTRSKRNLSSELGAACAISFENMMLISVPSGSKYNAHTWVLDQAPLENLSNGSCWAGVWTGTRPTQWAQGRIGAKNRLLYASYDKTSRSNTHIHIWEAFIDSREDDGGRITCSFQTALISGERISQFKYAEVEIVEMLGDVHLDIYVSGTRGKWHDIASIDMSAERGSLTRGLQLTTESIMQAYRPQARTKRTQEFNSQGRECSQELSGDTAGRDKGFMLLFVWKGRMGIREIRMITGDVSDYEKGTCAATESGQVNKINEAGEMA